MLGRFSPPAWGMVRLCLRGLRFLNLRIIARYESPDPEGTSCYPAADRKNSTSIFLVVDVAEPTGELLVNGCLQLFAVPACDRRSIA